MSDRIQELRKKYLGKTIKILDMKGEMCYNNKCGVVQHVDDIGQLHGSWGGCAILPELDSFTIITKEDTNE